MALAKESEPFIRVFVLVLLVRKVSGTIKGPLTRWGMHLSFLGLKFSVSDNDFWKNFFYKKFKGEAPMSNPDEILEELTSPKICFTEPKAYESQGAWCENCYGLMNRKNLKIKSKAFLDFDNPSSGFLNDNIQKYFFIMTSISVFKNAEKMKFDFIEGVFENMIFKNKKWFEMEAPPSYIAWPLLHYLSEFFDLNIYSLNGARAVLKIKHGNKIFENNKVSFECSQEFYKIIFEFDFS